MIRMTVISGSQSITKVCNTCGCHMDDLTMDDILVKPKVGYGNITLRDSQGTEITRTELPNSLCNCECEDCS
jgi:hypothetical protein